MMIDPFTYWSRVAASWQMAADTGLRAARTADASGEVIAARAAILGSAMRSPLTADYAELSRIVPEKVEAFSRAGTVFAHAWWQAQAGALSAMSRNMPQRIATPMDVAEYWSDVALDTLRAFESGARTARDTLAPIHAAATANARRLKRRGRAA